MTTTAATPVKLTWKQRALKAEQELEAALKSLETAGLSEVHEVLATAGPVRDNWIDEETDVPQLTDFMDAVDNFRALKLRP